VYTHTIKKKEDKSRAFANNLTSQQNMHTGALQLVNNRPEAVMQRTLRGITKNSQQVKHLKDIQLMADGNSLKTGDNKPVQRYLLPFKPKIDPKTEDEVEGKDAGDKVNNIVDTAYQQFLKNDFTGVSDAKKALYLRRKVEFDTNKTTMHPSTAAGYVIESKANVEIEKLGYHTQNTSLLKGTRPDVAVPLKSKNYALLDITAWNSKGHILDKKGNWTGHKHIPYVAEVTYPSLNFGGGLKKANVKPLTEEQIKEALEFIRKKEVDIELMRQEWLDAQRTAYENNQDIIEDLIDKLQNKKSKFSNKRVRAIPSSRTLDSWRDITGVSFLVDDDNPFTPPETGIKLTYDEMLEEKEGFIVKNDGVISIQSWYQKLIEAIN